MPKDYDTRQGRPADGVSGHPSVQPRERSRSRSPVVDEKARREAQRRAEMERLRAANQAEEEQSAQLARHAVEPAVKPQEQIVQVDEEELEGLDEEEQMRKLLGIEGFGTTKGRKVESNHDGLAAGAANKNKARKYRQYMNLKFTRLIVWGSLDLDISLWHARFSFSANLIVSFFQARGVSIGPSTRCDEVSLQVTEPFASLGIVNDVRFNRVH
jgi:hypothetical protein